MFAGGGLVARADGRPEGVPYAYKPPFCCEVAYLGYDWSGFYVGGHAGVAFAQSNWTIPGLGVAVIDVEGDLIDTGTILIEHTATGFAGGAHIGWQKQWGNTVAGLEVSYTALNGDVTSHVNALGVPVALSTEVSNLVLVTGRLGYAQDNMLAYLKAGYASADVDFAFRFAAPATGGSSSEREHGWTAGVGLEYAIRDNIILGLEYNYVRLNADERVLAPSPVASIAADIDIQTILARLSFRFGARSEAAVK